MAPERSATASKEVEELRKSRILRETRYQMWVANTVMVKKTDEAWRICTDFTNINKACPKDCYSLPEIDWKESKIDDDGILDVPNLDSSIVDMPLMICVLGMKESKIDDDGVLDVPCLDSRFNAKKSLNDKLAALNSFLSKSVEKSLPFFKRLKGCLEKKDFTWTREVNKAFEDMKRASSDDGSGTGLMIVSPEGMPPNRKRNENKRDHSIRRLTTSSKPSKWVLQRKTPLHKTISTNSKELLKSFQRFEVQYIRINQNKKADALSKLTSLTFEHLTKKVLVEKLANKSIYGKQIAEVATKEENSWMTPILEYLISGIQPDDKKLIRKIRVKAPKYRIIDGILHKRSFLTPWLRLPKQDMTPVTATWPLIQCGIDFVGPLLKALGKVKFLIVAVDYFTKWVEAKPLVSITGKHVESLTYGTKAVLPIEVSIPTKRTKKVDLVQNERDLRIHLEILEERREVATIKEAAYKKKLEKYYNKKVRQSVYKPGDYVLWLNSTSKVEYTGKMGQLGKALTRC
ncbi:reverse transcriptase domain-containing protein [Tanacetum coccineum]